MPKGKKPEKGKPARKPRPTIPRQPQQVFVGVRPPIKGRIAEILIDAALEKKKFSRCLLELKNKTEKQRKMVQQVISAHSSPVSIQYQTTRLAELENACIEFERLLPQLRTPDGKRNAFHQAIPSWIAFERKASEQIMGGLGFDLRFETGKVLELFGLNPASAMLKAYAAHFLDLAGRYAIVKVAIEDLHIRIQTKDLEFVERMLNHCANVAKQTMQIPSIPLRERTLLRDYYRRKEEEN